MSLDFSTNLRNIMYGGQIGGYCNGSFGNGYGYNSIFSNILFNSFNYGCCTQDCGNTNNALKFQLGSTLGSIVIMAAGCLINRKIEEKHTNSNNTKLENVNNEINEELEKLGNGVTEADYNNHNAKDEKVYVDRQNEITKSNTELNAKLEKLGEKVSDGQIMKLENDLANLDKNSETYVTDYNRINEEIKAAKEKNKQIDEIKKQLEENKKAQAKLDKDIEARQNEINKVKEKLDTLVDQKKGIEKAIQAEKDAKTSDAANGNLLSRKDFSKLGNINNDGTISFNEGKSGKNVKSGHLQDLYDKYLKSTLPADKIKYGKAFKKLLNETEGVELSQGIQTTFRNAEKLIDKYIKENTKA